MKTDIKYWNPVDKKWEKGPETPYLKTDFVSWEVYKRLKTTPVNAIIS
jgi:hypothetical protein